MSTLRQVVSRIRSEFKLVNSDDIISDRAIAAELRSAVITFIKQATDRRKLWASSNIFTQIDCLELIDVPLVECCEFTSDCTIKRSKHKLPKISEGIYGLLVQAVWSPDKMTRFNESTPTRHANMLKLGLKQRSFFFWLYNGYLYLSDPDVELIAISAYFEEDVPAHFNCCNDGCDDCSKSCPENPMDLEFKCPGYLEDIVVKAVAETLLKTYKRSKEDNTSDAKDDSI